VADSSISTTTDAAGSHTTTPQLNRGWTSHRPQPALGRRVDQRVDAEHRPVEKGPAGQCQVPGSMEARFSRHDGRRCGGAVVLRSLVLGRRHEAQLAV
jgi:hypothetical protein